MNQPDSQLLRASGANRFVASTVPSAKATAPHRHAKRRGGRKREKGEDTENAGAATASAASDGCKSHAFAQPQLHLAPTIFSLRRNDDGTATLHAVEQRRLSSTASKAATCDAPLHTRPLRLLSEASATAAPPAPICLSSEIVAFAVEGGGEGAMLPVLALSAASPAEAAAVSKGTPRPAALTALPDDVFPGPAPAAGPAVRAPPPLPVVPAATGSHTDTSFSLAMRPPVVPRPIHLSHALSVEDAEAPAPACEWGLPDAIPGSAEPSEQGEVAEHEPATPAEARPSSAASDAEACPASPPPYHTPTMSAAPAGSCHLGQAGLAALALPAEELHPSTIMYTSTRIARAIWREGFVRGVGEANAMVATTRASLHCGATCQPIPLDPNCPLLELIAFHTPLMPIDAAAGAARWCELVLASPQLYAEAVETRVIRIGLWGPFLTALGPAVLPAPLPLNFATASPLLRELLLACAWHEANRRESRALAHSVHSSGKVAVAMGGVYDLSDLAEWMCAAAGPGRVVGLAAAAAAAAAAAGFSQ